LKHIIIEDFIHKWLKHRAIEENSTIQKEANKILKKYFENDKNEK